MSLVGSAQATGDRSRDGLYIKILHAFYASVTMGSNLFYLLFLRETCFINQSVTGCKLKKIAEL